MEFRPTVAEELFRREVQSWLQATLPAGWCDGTFPRPKTAADRVAFARSWYGKLWEGGWAGLSWPREYGGRDLSNREHLVFSEEYVRAAAPDLIDVGVGPGLVGPTVIAHGTEAQKKRILPAILRGDEVWCQGFSEPGAGSDLAALQTRAVRDGDALVVTGQKVWTSFARFADWCILVVRTNPDVPKHRGLTFLMLDMRLAGITIRPLVEMTGVAWFNEVFLEDVRVPLDCVIGEIDRGWEIVITTLSHERASVTPYPRIQSELHGLVALLRSRADQAADPRLRQRIAALECEVEILRLSTWRSLGTTERDGRPGPEGSVLKLLWSELEQRLFELASEIAGPRGLLDEHDPAALEGGRWQYGMLWSRAATIYAGTSEVQRNIIAQRVLGLPRG